MQPTNIEWADWTTNPLRARNRATGADGHYCEHAGPECSNCYAEAWNLGTRNGCGTGLSYRPASRGKLDLYIDHRRLEEVRRSRRPGRVFWCSMTDLAGEWVSDDQLHMMHAVVRSTPHLSHQWLTKRPQRLAAFLRDRAAALGAPAPNLWVGTTAGDQCRAAERIPPLLGAPAAVRFLSCEPLLGPLDLAPWLPALHWVIVGGESCRRKADARPCDLAW